MIKSAYSLLNIVELKPVRYKKNVFHFYVFSASCVITLEGRGLIEEVDSFRLKVIT